MTLTMKPKKESTKALRRRLVKEESGVTPEILFRNNVESVQKLGKDLEKAAKIDLTRQEVRYLVQFYCAIQEGRIRTDKQVQCLYEKSEPHAVMAWYSTQAETMENSIKTILERFADNHQTGQWLMSICGIGPVIAAGLLAHVDPEKAITAGAVWRFAGLDPTVKWEKGKKRPWNAKLKCLMWKAGQSFCKVQNKEGDFYGHIYASRKQLEIERNDAGKFAEIAKERVKSVGKDTEAYKFYSQGKLPPGHIDARARRYAVHIFAAHFQQVYYEQHHRKPAVCPYILTPERGHAHYIAPPNYEPLKRTA